MEKRSRANQAKGKSKGKDLAPAKPQREEIDIFADMMNTSAFHNEVDAHAEAFVEAFTNTIIPSTPITIIHESSNPYGFKPSKEQAFDIPIDHILDSPFQNRLDKSQWTAKQKHDYDRLRLAVRRGLNEVFFVAPYPDKEGYFFLAYGGHNRRDASKEEGYTHIPCIIIDYDPQNSEDQEKVGFGTAFENEVKVQMTLEERGNLYKQLMRDFKLSQQKLADSLDLTRDTIKNCIMIAESPDDVRDLVRDLEDGGIRIARSLNTLNVLKDLMNNVAAPHIARTPLIKKYKAGEMKTEIAEAYINEIILLTQQFPEMAIEEILHRVFSPPQTEQRAAQDVQSQESPLTSSAQTNSRPADARETRYSIDTTSIQVSQTNVSASTQDRTDVTTPSFTATPLEQLEHHSPSEEAKEVTANITNTSHTITNASTSVTSNTSASSTTSLYTSTAEVSLRLDKLLKAQRYFQAYCKLVTGKTKSDQEIRILKDILAALQEELPENLED